jgi:hypothetical protein
MYSRITSNVTNFRVNITKIERSRKKHYEKCSWPGVVYKKHHENVQVNVLTPPASRYRHHDVFLKISEHFNE